MKITGRVLIGLVLGAPLALAQDGKGAAKASEQMYKEIKKQQAEQMKGNQARQNEMVALQECVMAVNQACGSGAGLSSDGDQKACVARVQNQSKACKKAAKLETQRKEREMLNQAAGGSGKESAPAVEDTSR